MMSESNLKQILIDSLHSIHDDTLHSMQTLENLLKVFGEDMSWYENWRATHTKEQGEKKV